MSGYKLSWYEMSWYEMSGYEKSYTRKESLVERKPGLFWKRLEKKPGVFFLCFTLIHIKINELCKTYAFLRGILKFCQYIIKGNENAIMVGFPGKCWMCRVTNCK